MKNIHQKMGALVCGGFTTVFIYLGLFYFSSLPPKASTVGNISTTRPSYKFSRSKQEISGFKYTYYCGGKNSFAFAADSLNIRKKKLGFLRFGLLSKALIRNARIDIFLHQKREGYNEDPSLERIADLTNNGTKKDAGRKHGSPNLPDFNGDNDDDANQLGNISIKDFITLLSPKRISEVFFQKISLSVHKENNEIATIYADSASLRLRDGTINFKGNVTLYSGFARLSTTSLEFNPQNQGIYVKSNYLIKNKHTVMKGQNLQSNIFLQSISVKSS